MPLSVGDKLGPYEILAPIGAGGMGEVWKARDTRLNRIVAIKSLRAGNTVRLEQEARTIAALNHPHICQIYDIGQDYLVMEYIEGAPPKGPLPVEDALRLALQVASALEAAHRQGIIHRDLKPANILVNAACAKLLDFGLAKLNDETAVDFTRTLDGAVVGTAAYMSPEQAEGKPVDARSDIFSFGAVLYEMLSGRRAFAGGSMASVLSAILRDDPQAPGVSAQLDRFVLRCLAKRPEQRFQTMAELKVALEQVSTGSESHHASIAVLPFEDLSPGKDNEYFSDGLAEEVINALTQVSGLKVSGRTSSFYFRGKDMEFAEIGRRLNVEHILEGSVRKAGNRIRVTAQLIKMSDGFHLWSERYDRDMEDVFAIQDEIAQAIASALQVKLAPVAASGRHTPNPAAYEAILKARHWHLHLARDPTTNAPQARRFFEQAIALDPEFALAYSELGAHFLMLPFPNLASAHETMPQARGAAQKALDIDPQLAEAHAVLGSVAALYDYDWKESERHFRVAMAQPQVPPSIRTLYGTTYLQTIGRPLEAAAELERAVRDDPLSFAGRLQGAICLFSAGMHAEVEAELRKLMEFENVYQSFYFLALNYASQGKTMEALDHARQALALAPHNIHVRAVLAALSYRSGDSRLWEELLNMLGDGRAFGAPVAMVLLHGLSDHFDQAVDWSEKIIEQRDPRVGSIYFPFLKPMRSTSRWNRLMQLMNLVAS
jgi:eukaryotic-like serine/threonine-protein kinase